MTRTARLSLAGLVCVFASGCITASTIIHVKPDGSGTIEQALAMKAEAAEQLAAMASGFGGDSAKPEAGRAPARALQREGDARRRHEVRRRRGVCVEHANQDQRAGRRPAIYSFTDITKVHINQKPPAPKDGMAPPSKSADDVAFMFARHPGGSSR